MFPFVSLIISFSYISIFPFITFVSRPFFHLPFHELKKNIFGEENMSGDYDEKGV
jgi:hypothetical protein